MNKALFPQLPWFLLLLIPFTFFGFYPSYFSKLFATTTIFHVHAFFMLLWILLAIIQPWLIQQKKKNHHKVFDRVSYFVMPIVFITTYLVIRHTYFEHIQFEIENVEKGISILSDEQIKAKAAARIALGSVYFIWLAIFYCLAIINRKKTLAHATYMFAAILTILGPTVYRLIFNVLSGFNLPYYFLAENAIFISILLILISLIAYQKQMKYTIKPASISLCICLTGLLAFFTLQNTKLWNSLIDKLF